jgi:phage terminase large subunit-like protein
MSDEKIIIIKYLLLCTVRAGSKKHILTDVSDENLSTIITKKEMSIYFKKHDGDLIVKESVVGGDTARAVIIY